MLNNILSWIYTSGIVLVVIAIFTYTGYKLLEQQEEERTKYRAQIIQEFCERSDYDFCEIEKIIYKERVEENADR